jgi:guanidinopropionase
VEIIRERVGNLPIYVTFDLDCLDPTVAPAVANIEPAFTGFTMSQAVRLIQSLQGLNIIGGDVACLMPTKDSPNKITALVASSIMFEILCLIADRLRTEGKARTQ